MKVPEGWELTRIREAASVITGTTPSTKDPDNYGDEYLFVSPGDLGNGKYINATEKKLSVKGFRQSRSIRKGSTLFTCIGSTIGKVGVAGQELATNQQINAVICDRDKADDEYVYYALDFRAPKIKLLAGTQAVPIINKSTFENQKLLLPPLPEQRKIAEILGTWDEAIALTERRIEAAQQRKKGLMQRLLTGRVRFPEFEGEAWQTVKLGEIFDERTERGYEELPLLSVTAEEGIIYRDELDRRDTSSSDKSNYLRVREGDVTYNTMRMWQGRSGVSEYEGIVSPAYTVCEPKPSIDVVFAGYLFQLPSVIYKFRRYSQGMVSDTWTLRFDNFAAIKVQIPSLEEQKKIAAVLQTCDREIELLTQKRDALQRQKKGLMQRLLTGRVRVEV